MLLHHQTSAPLEILVVWLLKMGWKHLLHDDKFFSFLGAESTVGTSNVPATFFKLCVSLAMGDTATDSIVVFLGGLGLKSNLHTVHFRANQKANPLDVAQLFALRRPKLSTLFRYEENSEQTISRQCRANNY